MKSGPTSCFLKVWFQVVRAYIHRYMHCIRNGGIESRFLGWRLVARSISYSALYLFSALHHT